MKYKVSLLVKIEDFEYLELLLNGNDIEIQNEEIIQGKDDFNFTKVTLKTPIDSKLMDEVVKFDNYPVTVVKIIDDNSREIEQIMWGI